jgi:hypothetical protein
LKLALFHTLSHIQSPSPMSASIPDPDTLS